MAAIRQKLPTLPMKPLRERKHITIRKDMNCLNISFYDSILRYILPFVFLDLYTIKHLVELGLVWIIY